MNDLLAISVLLAVSSVGHATLVPQQGEGLTEFYVLTETDDGELVADDYPTKFELGERKPIVRGLANEVHEVVDYTVVVQLQRVTFHPDPAIISTEIEVLERDKLRRFQPSLGHDETCWSPTRSSRR